MMFPNAEAKFSESIEANHKTKKQSGAETCLCVSFSLVRCCTLHLLRLTIKDFSSSRVHTTLPEGPKGLPEGLKGLPEGPEGMPEGPEGLPEGPEDLPGAQGEMFGWTYGRMDGHIKFLPILQDFVPCWGCCPEKRKDNQSLTGIVWSAAPLPCYFDVVKSQGKAGQLPREGVKS